MTVNRHIIQQTPNNNQHYYRPRKSLETQRNSRESERKEGSLGGERKGKKKGETIIIT